MNGFIQTGVRNVKGFTRWFDIPKGRTRFMVEKNWKKDLKAAIENGLLDIDMIYVFDALLHSEFSFDITVHDKPYPLFFHAAVRGNTKVVRFLVENGHVDVNQKDQRGWTAMDYAQKCRRYDVIHYLVEAGSIH